MIDVEGPIGNERSLPYGSAIIPGSAQARLLEEYGYV